MTNYLLDSSAVLAVLLQEKGADFIETILDNAFISAVNECEVLTKLLQKGVSLHDAKHEMSLLINQIVPFDTNIATIAASIIKHTNKLGLSLGDRACLATAQYLKYEIITADKVWQKLELPIKIRLIR